MTLKNKDIAEGMYVTNGKDIWKVLDWNSKYTDCLLQKIDKNGNKMDLFVVAENYELYGDEKEPQIAWMNGDYCIEKRQIDAEQYFVDFYKDNKMFKESLKEKYIGDDESIDAVRESNLYKCAFELNKEYKKNYIVTYEKTNLGQFIVFRDKNKSKCFEFSIWDNEPVLKLDTTYKNQGMCEMENDYSDVLQNARELLRIYGNEVHLKEGKKSLKESKEFFVGDKTAQGFEIYMIEDGKKYYLSKLTKNIEDSSWSSDHTYAKHWKDESKAEEIVDTLNSELKESKKSARKTMNEKISSKYVYNFKNNGDYMISMFDDYNFEILAIPNDKSLFSKDLPKFKIEKTYIYEQYNDDIWLFVGEVEELGWCFIAFDKYANNSNVYAYQYGDNEKYAYIPFRSYILYLENKKVYRTHNVESKKSSRKSLKESAKPINEKNVAKFVDELNKWCDDNVHYVDVDSAKFTKQYGKLYDFKYDWDYSYGDKGDLLVWDDCGTLDWYEDEVVVPFIKELAKKYGWYCEPSHSYADFMLAEL